MRIAGFLLIVGALSLCLSGTGWGETVQLQGAILDESGKPVTGAELFLYDSSGTTRRPADYISPKTGADGRFSMKVPTGVYRGIARLRHSEKFGPLLSGDLHSGEPRKINTAETLGDVIFTVVDIREVSRTREKSQSVVSLISGKVQNQDGQPSASVTVYAWQEPLSQRLPDAMSSWTENDGLYSLYLPPGSYLIMASTAYPPVVAEGRTLKLTVAETRKDVVVNLQISETATNPRGDRHTHPDGISHDDE